MDTTTDKPKDDDKKKEKKRLTAPLATLLAGVCGIVGGALQAYISKPHGDDPQKPLEKVVVNDSDSPKGGADGWVEGFQPDIAYKADTDGILAVYTGGNNPARGATLLTGSNSATLKPRTRVGGSYDGAVLPVRKDEYWLVVREFSSSGTVVIQWRPDKR
jgi:hypothetical protein